MPIKKNTVTKINNAHKFAVAKYPKSKNALTELIIQLGLLANELSRLTKNNPEVTKIPNEFYRNKVEDQSIQVATAAIIIAEGELW